MVGSGNPTIEFSHGYGPAGDGQLYEEELLRAPEAAELAGAQLCELNRQLLRSNAAMHEQRERLRVTLDAIRDGVVASDAAGIITYMNPAAADMTGWTEAEAIGRSLQLVYQVMDGDTERVAPDPVAKVLDGKSTREDEYRVLLRRDGKRISIKDSGVAIRDEHGQATGVVLVIQDVTQEREMAARLNWQASHDSLTGLINRREFRKRVQMVLQPAYNHRGQHSVLFIDLDQFKVVNDTCGHSAGDELLRQIVTIMRSKLRGCDALARIGGDEFGVLLECCSGETALRIAEALRQTVKDFRFVWPNNVFRIGASIGLASFGNDGVIFPEVLRRADAACYVAKAAGRNRVHVFTPDDKEVEKRAGELQWLRRIQKALDTQQFVLYSQRIVPLRKDGGLLPHNEILLRCRDESGKLVSPAVFVPAAERYGFMPQIDRWVIATVFSQYAQAHVHCDEKRAPLYAINVSGTSIGDSGFLDFVREQFRRHQVPPQAICFEITETSAIANLTEAASLMEDLKAMGCRIALDDFGSGMSSFGYLKHLPVDFLKIDGSLVKDILDDPVSFAMVDSVNRIGHVMGIQTIAEFAENEAILDVLRGMGVDYAQGYGVQRPVPMRIAG